MSRQNDEIFAKFMVTLAKKIVVRKDDIAERHAQLADWLLNVTTNGHHPMAIYASHSGIIGYDLAAATPFCITEDEVAVIRAYFNGEDVLTTILSQER